MFDQEMKERYRRHLRPDLIHLKQDQLESYCVSRKKKGNSGPKPMQKYLLYLSAPGSGKHRKTKCRRDSVYVLSASLLLFYRMVGSSNDVAATYNVAKRM
mmetsp:Transcript_21633/g.32758  ORF Transcript_21633/g.32758 Transcript_21633/m.32758 type:complete len:100 (+) Transcript_21633:3668-3967(+)